MLQTTPLIVCAHNWDKPCGATEICTVLFEAPTLPELGRSLSDWIATRPGSHIVSFSHACETRLEPGSSLAGPRRNTVYTGVLLVSAASFSEANSQVAAIQTG